MFLDPRIRDQAYQFFINEALELLQTIEEGLLNLKHDRSGPKMHNLLRAAHSLKGGAASVGLDEIKSIAHRLENILQVFYRQETEVDLQLEQLLFQAYDCLRLPLLDQIQIGHYDAEEASSAAETVFAQLEELLNLDTAQAELSTTVELGVDITHAVFDIDVAEGIERIETDLARPEFHLMAGEIKSQLEDFAGIGELLHLPGFAAIARTALSALQAAPGQIQRIGQLVVSDLWAARAAVLAGDRSTGGTPCAELIRLGRMPDIADAIRQLFPQLPPAIDLQPTETSIVPAPAQLSIAPHHVQSISPQSVASEASPNQVIRVDLSRLERLNNLVGELAIQDNSLLLQHEQLQDTLRNLANRFGKFEQLTNELKNWADRLTSMPQNQAAANAEFDPQQMDFYTHMHTLLQTAVEEMAQVGEAMGDMSLLNQQSQNTLHKRQQTLKQVQNDLLWSRMLPIGDILHRFPRMVYDLATEYHKQVTLDLGGEDTLVDKAILEKLYDPLVHLVRNAFDHGIETPDIRLAQGKPPQGIIQIRAYHQGNQTYIEVRDDGQGFNLERIRSTLVAHNLMSFVDATKLSAAQLYEYMFAPGFSTAEQVSEVSGRGMGLDAVRSQVTALKGTISLTSEPGQGTKFTLRFPLTLTIAKLLVFSIKSTLMAAPLDTLVDVVAASEEKMQTLHQQRFYRWQQQMIPVYSLGSLLSYQYPLMRTTNEQPQAMPLPQTGKMPLLLVNSGSQVVALEVEHLVREQELVIKSFGGATEPPPYLYGCTVLGDGRLVPVVDGPTLLAHKLPTGTAPFTPSIAAGVSSEARRKAIPLTAASSQKKADFVPEVTSSPRTILVIDDSVTMRQTLSLTLSKCGYRVIQARNGREALEQLEQNPEIQLIFCDIEMPQMNGFEFLTAVRQKPSLSSIPVIMLTFRSSEEHRQLANQLGAAGYLTKPYLKQELLVALQTSLGERFAANSRPLS